MSIIHLDICKPLNWECRVQAPGKSWGHTIIGDKDHDLTLVFPDLETIKEFAQMMVGFAAKAEQEGQV
jgi:hypothetical protein